MNISIGSILILGVNSYLASIIFVFDLENKEFRKQKSVKDKIYFALTIITAALFLTIFVFTSALMVFLTTGFLILGFVYMPLNLEGIGLRAVALVEALVLITLAKITLYDDWKMQQMERATKRTMKPLQYK